MTVGGPAPGPTGPGIADLLGQSESLSELKRLGPVAGLGGMAGEVFLRGSHVEQHARIADSGAGFGHVNLWDEQGLG